MAVKKDNVRVLITLSKETVDLIDKIRKDMGVSRSSYIQSSLLFFWKILSNTKIK